MLARRERERLQAALDAEERRLGEEARAHARQRALDRFEREAAPKGFSSMTPRRRASERKQARQRLYAVPGRPAEARVYA